MILIQLFGNEEGPVIQIKVQDVSSGNQRENKSSTEHNEKPVEDKREDLNPEYMFPDEAAKYLKTTQKKLALFRKYQLVKYTRFGKTFVYKKTWLDDFAEEWAGYDLSNEGRIRLSMKEKDWRQTHDIGKPKKQKPQGN
ncbi:MAG: hypothetical protein IKD69_12440 [Solobacterium sp.]|nr:hypothetical protein [Solobacterium sp.]